VDARAVDLPDFDLRDSKEAVAAVWNCDYVIHLAADMGGVGYFHAHDYYPALDNALVTRNVLLACEKANVSRLFYASSACAYPIELQQGQSVPKLHEGLLDEGTPDQMYGREKLTGLRLCERAPFDARVGILHTVYGPYQEREGERMKFPAAVATKAIRSKQTGEPLHLWGDGTQQRSYLYVDDAVEMILAVMFRDEYSGPVNIGYEGARSCDQIARVCLDYVGADVPVEHSDDGPTGVLARDCDLSKFTDLYGFGPKVTPEDGFPLFIDWLRCDDVDSHD
jgi:nucleoside-diphosphate-sugar epimerase